MDGGIIDMDSLKVIENGSKAPQTFSDTEMNERLHKLRAVMAGRQIDAVLFTSFHGIKYYSDFLYCAFGRPYGLVVTQDACTTISANIDGGQPWRRSVGDNLVYTDWQRDNYFRAIASLVPARGRIGVEFDHFDLQRARKLADALPGLEQVDIAGDCMKLRMFKSAEEQAIIRDGAAVADIGGAAVVEALLDLGPHGVAEWEVARHATGAMIAEITRRYPDSEVMDTWTWFQSGINTDGAHNPLTTRQVQDGDILSLNTFPMIAGYYTALERTLFYKHAPDRALELWRVNVEVHERGLELIKPGARCCDIAAELNEIYARHGLLANRTFGYGHSFGVLSHYYGREAGLELREDIDTVLEPNMVVSMEPMIMIPEGHPEHGDGAGGYREHDILIVNETGAENITKFPFGPEHNIVGE